MALRKDPTAARARVPGDRPQPAGALDPLVEALRLAVERQSRGDEGRAAPPSPDQSQDPAAGRP
jgi:hypothetical protein